MTTTQRRQLVVTVGCFLLAGAAGGVLWRLVVDLPAYSRTADNGSMEALELSRAVAIDGWYAVIAAVLALVLGGALTGWGIRGPRLQVLSLLPAGAAGGLLMLGVGHWLGPGDVESRLAAADVGDRVPVELVPNSTVVDVIGVHVHVIFLVWPIAALVGALLVLVLRPVPQPLGSA